MLQPRSYLAGWLGFFIVSYDGALASVVLAPAFGYFLPADADPLTIGAILLTVFNASRIGRPLGALLFGRMVDRGGVVPAASVSAIGYAILTVATGLLPGFATVGYWSLGLLIGLRALTGIFLAGQAVAFGPNLVRAAPPAKRWLVGAMLPTGSPASYICASLLTLLVLAVAPSAGPDSPYVLWGWRVAFWTAAAISAGSFVLALMAGRAGEVAKVVAAPVAESPARRGVFLRVLLLLSGIQIVLSTAVASLPGYLIHARHYDATAITWAVLVAYALMVLAYFTTGLLSSRLGASKVFIGWAIVATILSVATLQFLNVLPPGEHIGFAIAGLIAVTIVSLSVAGFMHTYSIEAFSSSVVATGYGTARSLSEFVPVLSGLYLMGLGFIVGDAAAPAALLAIGGCLVIAGALLVDRHRNAPLLPPTTQDAT